MQIQTETIPTWTDFMRLCASDFTDVWHFRGALDNWILETALQRTARNWRIPLKEIPQIEQALLREFMRAYPPDASTPPPDNNDTLGWLSLMQHHGAPTRLLDWSYSPYVAAFFGLDALLRHGDENRKAAVWALSYKPLAAAQNLVPAHLGKAFQEYAMTREGALFRTIFMDAEPPITFAPIVNPYRLHERLVLQQGVFLCQGNICLPFEENLLAYGRRQYQKAYASIQCTIGCIQEPSEYEYKPSNAFPGYRRLCEEPTTSGRFSSSCGPTRHVLTAVRL